MEHTELPWIVSATPLDNPSVVRIESEHKHGVDNDGWIIAEMLGPDALANAAYIVKACKAFPAMEKALRTTQYALIEHGNLDHVWTPSLTAIEAALAAGGE